MGADIWLDDYLFQLDQSNLHINLFVGYNYTLTIGLL